MKNIFIIKIIFFIILVNACALCEKIKAMEDPISGDEFSPHNPRLMFETYPEADNATLKKKKENQLDTEKKIPLETERAEIEKLAMYALSRTNTSYIPTTNEKAPLQKEVKGFEPMNLKRPINAMLPIFEDTPRTHEKRITFFKLMTALCNCQNVKTDLPDYEGSFLDVYPSLLGGPAAECFDKIMQILEDITHNPDESRTLDYTKESIYTALLNGSAHPIPTYEEVEDFVHTFPSTFNPETDDIQPILRNKTLTTSSGTWKVTTFLYGSHITNNLRHKDLETDSLDYGVGGHSYQVQYRAPQLDNEWPLFVTLKCPTHLLLIKQLLKAFLELELSSREPVDS